VKRNKTDLDHSHNEYGLWETFVSSCEFGRIEEKVLGWVWMIFAGRRAVLATMHHKERAIAPILEPLGIQIVVPQTFDTDAFGTFTREVKRVGDQREAARQKAIAAMELMKTDLAIASEGSFVPHPALPILPCDRELVMLIDRANDLEIVGEAISTETNFDQRSITSFEEAQEFALKVGFPEHGLIARVNDNSAQMIKGITTLKQLQDAILRLSKLTEAPIYLETDMRAMYNPTRMKVIAQATQDLLQKISHCCSRCSTPGFELVEHKLGLPCDWCGSPTNQTLAHVYRCQKCGFIEEVLFPQGARSTDPSQCPYCNP
jgi:DNA-directed RNA polymerase subunit RPC12/RpoP